MPGAIYKQGIGEVTQSKSKGKKFVEELNKRVSPERIAKEIAKTQECKLIKY